MAKTWQTFAHDADIGVRGTGDTLAEAFAGAALALTATVCDPGMVRPRSAVDIECAPVAATPGDAGLELLLVDWLNALVFAMATRRMLFSRFDVVIDELGLHAQAWGEPVDVERHEPAAEPKGASFCELEVDRTAGGRWRAQCVVDV